MIFKFLILSDEVDDFAREISIDSEATFLELNDAILESVNYTKDQMTSFFICEDDWEKKTEITLMEMDTNFEDDSWVMAETRLSELLEDEKQRLIFVLELREIVPGKNLDKAICSKSKGNPPTQLMDFDELEKTSNNTDTGLGENFYGDESFDPSELDEEGYNDLDMTEGNNSFNDY